METPALPQPSPFDPPTPQHEVAFTPAAPRSALRGAAGLPYLVVAGAAILLRLPTLNNNILSIDEAQYFAQAARLRSLEAFVYAFYYRTEVKSQVGLIPYMAAAALDPANAVFWDHLFGLLLVLLSGGLMVAISRHFLGNSWPGAVAALVWLPYTLVGPGYAFSGRTVLEAYPAPKLEYFQTPFLLVAVYAFAQAVIRSRTAPSKAAWWMVTAGLAWAISVLIKPSSLLLGPLYLALLPLLLRRAHQRTTVAEVVRLALPFVGAAAAGAVVFGPYLWYPAALGELQFNLLGTAGSYTNSTDAGLIIRLLALLLTGMPPALLVLFLLGPFLARRYLRTGEADSPVLPLLAGTGPLLLLVSLAGCVCPHYYSPIVALLLLTIAMYLAPVFQMLWLQGKRQVVWRGGILLLGTLIGPQIPALLAFPQAATTDSYRADDSLRFDLSGLLTYIDTHTQPQQSIWVYYNTSEIYLWAARPPATRDPQADWMSYFWTEPWFSRTAAELATDQPALIIAIQQPRFPRLQASTLEQIPQVSGWIAAHYRCDNTRVRGVTICAPNAAPSNAAVRAQL